MSTPLPAGYVPPVAVGYEDFPESTRTAAGMLDLPADHAPAHPAVRLGVPYVRRATGPLHVHVVTPPVEPHERLPLVVYVQGSGWFAQDLGAGLPALVEVARRGYVVASVEYRPSPVAPFPAQALDVATAVRWLRAHADDLQVDPARVALWGDSSGGHTTLMAYVAGDGPVVGEDGDVPPLGVRCFVDYYGPTDVGTMNCEPSTMDHLAADSPEGVLLGGVPVLADPARLAPTVVAHHVRADVRLAPLLMVHGSKDRLVPFGQSVTLFETLRDAGQDVTFYRLRGADHGGPPFWQPAVLDVVDAFLRRHLGPAT